MVERQAYILQNPNPSNFAELLERSRHVELMAFWKPTVDGDFLIDFHPKELKPMGEDLDYVLRCMEGFGARLIKHEPNTANAKKAYSTIMQELAKAGQSSLEVAVCDVAGDLLAGGCSMRGSEVFAAGQPCYAPDAEPVQVIMLKNGIALYGVRLPAPHNGQMYAVLNGKFPDLVKPLSEICKSLTASEAVKE